MANVWDEDYIPPPKKECTHKKQRFELPSIQQLCDTLPSPTNSESGDRTTQDEVEDPMAVAYHLRNVERQPFPTQPQPLDPNSRKRFLSDMLQSCSYRDAPLRTPRPAPLIRLPATPTHHLQQRAPNPTIVHTTNILPSAIPSPSPLPETMARHYHSRAPPLLTSPALPPPMPSNHQSASPKTARTTDPHMRQVQDLLKERKMRLLGEMLTTPHSAPPPPKQDGLRT